MFLGAQCATGVPDPRRRKHEVFPRLPGELQGLGELRGPFRQLVLVPFLGHMGYRVLSNLRMGLRLRLGRGWVSVRELRLVLLFHFQLALALNIYTSVIIITQSTPGLSVINAFETSFLEVKLLQAEKKRLIGCDSYTV